MTAAASGPRPLWPVRLALLVLAFMGGLSVVAIIFSLVVLL